MRLDGRLVDQRQRRKVVGAADRPRIDALGCEQVAVVRHEPSGVLDERPHRGVATAGELAGGQPGDARLAGPCCEHGHRARQPAESVHPGTLTGCARAA
jgi:hypothetical protein